MKVDTSLWNLHRITGFEFRNIIVYQVVWISAKADSQPAVRKKKIKSIKTQGSLGATIPKCFPFQEECQQSNTLPPWKLAISRASGFGHGEPMKFQPAKSDCLPTSKCHGAIYDPGKLPLRSGGKLDRARREKVLYATSRLSDPRKVYFLQEKSRLKHPWISVPRTPPQGGY